MSNTIIADAAAVVRCKLYLFAFRKSPTHGEMCGRNGWGRCNCKQSIVNRFGVRVSGERVVFGDGRPVCALSRNRDANKT